MSGSLFKQKKVGSDSGLAESVLNNIAQNDRRAQK